MRVGSLLSYRDTRDKSGRQGTYDGATDLRGRIIMARYEKTVDAAAEVHMSPSFLYKNWHCIPAARRAGRALRWDMDELKRWMASQAEGSR